MKFSDRIAQTRISADGWPALIIIALSVLGVATMVVSLVNLVV